MILYYLLSAGHILSVRVSVKYHKTKILFTKILLLTLYYYNMSS